MGGGDKIMPSVDNRIVNMQFNNGQFERGIQTSVRSLEALKKGLKLDESARSLSNLNSVGRSFSLGGIADGVQNISSKFTTMGIVGVTALVNITNAAINAGVQLVKSLMIGPISQGYDDYIRKLTSIQTIMNATGESNEVVTKYFDQLDEYADQTIYNLDDMTSAFAKFTNAGVKMDKSIPAIKGIANMVALAGQGANAADIAFYNLSQSISNGFLTTMDYRSLNLANVATIEWKDNIIKAAEAAGTIKKTTKDMYLIPGVKEAVTKQALFAEELSKGWATTEVLLKVFGEYGDATTEIGKKAQAAAQEVKDFGSMMETLKAQVGTSWTDTFLTVIGGLEESKTLYTNLSKVIGGFLDKTNDARNEMLEFWKVAGGRTVLIEGLSNTFKAIGQVLKTVGEAFREIFPPMTGQKLVDMTVAFRNLSERFKMSEETATNLKNTYKGLYAAFDIIYLAVAALVRALGKLLKAVAPIGDSFLVVSGGLGNFIVGIDKALRSSDAFNVIVENLGKVIIPVIEGLVRFISLIAEAFKTIATPDMTGVDAFVEKVEERFDPLVKIGEALKGIIGLFYDLATLLGKAFSNMMKDILGAINGADYNAIFDIINGSLFAMILYGIKNFIKSLTNITDNAGSILGSITGIFDGVRGCLEAYQQNLKANVLLKIAGAVAILAAALFTLSMIDSEKLTTSLGAVTGLFIELFAAMSFMSGLTGIGGFLGIFAITTAMIGLSIAILLLSSAMKKMETLNWKNVISGLVGVAGLAAILVIASKNLEIASKGLIRGSIGLVIFAGAILLLVRAVERLGKLDVKQLAKGLVGVGILMAELTLFMKYAEIGKMGMSSSIGILIMAGALLVLSKAVEKLSKLDLGQLARGLGSIGVLLASLAIFMRFSGGSKNVIATAISLTILSVALNVLALAIMKLSTLTWEEIAKGMVALGMSLGMIVFMFKKMPNNIFIKSVALLDVAGAILMLAGALKTLSELSWEEIGRSLLALAGSLGLIMVAFVLMSKYSGIADSFAFGILILGILGLAAALKMLGSMSLQQIGISLLALAGAFAVIGAAAFFLQPLVVPMLLLGGALLVLGIGVSAIGGGLLLLAAGLTALAAGGTAGIVALVAVVSGLVGLIPFVFQTLAEGFIKFAKTIGDNAPIVMDAFKSLILAMLDMIVETSPKIIDAFFDILLTILDAINLYLPQLIQAGVDIVVNFLKGISSNIQRIVEVGVELVVNFIKGVSQTLPLITQTAFDLIISFINSLADAIRNNMPLLKDAMINLFKAVIGAGIFILTGSTPEFTKAGSDMVDGMIEGIKNKVEELIKIVTEMIESVIQTVKDLLGIKSPSEEFQFIGENVVDGFAYGLKNNTISIDNAVSYLVNKVKTNFKRGLASLNLARLIEQEINLTPTIRPVVDMSNVTKGMDNVFNSTPGIAPFKSSTDASFIEQRMPTVAPQTPASVHSISSYQNVKHSGTITVEGVNNEGQLIAVIEQTIDKSFTQGNRRLPTRVTTIPSMA